MKLSLDIEKLQEVMQNFYVVTKIRISVYDRNYNKILAYPEDHCSICQIMHNHREGREQCRQSNLNAFEICNKSQKLVVYDCHIGLKEVIAPVKDNHIIIGYIIFGQITTGSDRIYLESQIQNACAAYELADVDLQKELRCIQFRTMEEIASISRIAEACTLYLIYKEIIRLNKTDFTSALDAFIERNIREELSVSLLCEEFGVGRTKLYEMVNESLHVSIGQYIRRKRMKLTKELLESTNLTIMEIADRVGIPDYNYFCSVLKKETGMTAKQIRRKIRGEVCTVRPE